MELTKNILKVIADLEYIVGSECYNPKSYDGWNDIEGCSFRYPINILNPEGEYVKERSNINNSLYIEPKYINETSINSMKYKFGSNQLYIGKALINTLTYLEDRYGINFNELEENRKTSTTP